MWPHTMFSHVYQSMSNAWNNPHVNFPRWGKYGNASQLIEPQPDRNLTVFFSHFSSDILFYTYLHTIYIKFI